MIKMIVMDLDGTLLNDDKNISAYTMSILEKCKETGIKIVIASGRSRAAAEEIIDLIKPDFSILNYGTLIIDKNNVIIYIAAFSLGMPDGIFECMGKMNAIEILSKEQNISLSEIAAFGDGFYDIGMIKYCGTGVAMENAPDAVKIFAKNICENNNDDGVAKWIEENILK